MTQEVPNDIEIDIVVCARVKESTLLERTLLKVFTGILYFYSTVSFFY